MLLPFGGTLIDRLGARPIVVFASLWLAATLVYLSASDRLAALGAQLLGLDDAAPLGLVLLVLGFVSLRFSGQGMLTLVSRTTLGKWFDRRRGFVSGLSGVFVSFGFSSAPLLLSLLVKAAGWRQAWLLLALGVGAGMGLLGWLFYRDNPEECALLMDGEPHPTVARPEVAASSPGQLRQTSFRDFTRGEALATLAFWAVTLALASQALTITGITFHIVDIGAAAGLPETQAVAIFLPIAVISTTVGYTIGVASDRMNLKWLFLGMMVFEALGVASMAHIDILAWRGAAILGLGVSGGCFGTLTTVALPNYFGRRHLGAISGVQMMSMVVASALGPSLLAWFEAQFAAYQWGLYASALLPVLAFFLVLASRHPQATGDRR